MGCGDLRGIQHNQLIKQGRNGLFSQLQHRGASARWIEAPDGSSLFLRSVVEV